MAQPVRQRHAGPLSQMIGDGRVHPLQDALAVLTLVLGVVALITAAFPSLHVFTVCVGIVGVAAGAWGLFISATIGERWALIVGLGTAAVGFYVGVNNGGFVP